MKFNLKLNTCVVIYLIKRRLKDDKDTTGDF